MKLIFSLVFSLVVTSSFASTVSETIAQIEQNYNAKCERTGGSLFNLCTGSIPREGEVGVPFGCRYTAKYQCWGSNQDFKLKLKVVETYNYEKNERESQVLKVEYIY